MENVFITNNKKSEKKWKIFTFICFFFIAYKEKDFKHTWFIAHESQKIYVNEHKMESQAVIVVGLN